MSNHRPRNDPGPSRTLIAASAVLALIISAVSDWILLGGAHADDRHVTGFAAGNTLAVLVIGQTIVWASERATAQARIRRFKELEECQEQSRKRSHPQPWMDNPGTVRSFRKPARFTEPYRSSSAGGKTLHTYRGVQEDTTRLELVPSWASAETEVVKTGEAAETQVIRGADETVTLQATGIAETQVVTTDATGEAGTETVRIVTGEAAETQVVAGGDGTQPMEAGGGR